MLLGALSFFVIGCGNSYDRGYEDGWESTKNGISSSLSKNYRQGYEDGANDAYYFNLGCHDADNGDSAKYPDIQQYMQGFVECS